MEDMHDPLVQVDEGGGGDERAALLDHLRSMHKEQAERDYAKFMPLPGTGRMMWAKFVPFPVGRGTKKAKAIARRLDSDDDGVVLDASCDTLIDACQEIMLLKPKFNGEIGKDGKNLIPVDDEAPIRFDSRFAMIMELDLGDDKTARNVVKQFFPTEQGILDMSQSVNIWLKDVTAELDEDFLGE